MKQMTKRLGSLILSIVMLLSMAVTPAMAAGTQNPPTKIQNCEVSRFMTETLNLGFNDTTWLNAITQVVVNDTQYEKAALSRENGGNIWNIGTVTGAYGSYQALQIVTKFSFPATIVISANGYKDLKVQVTKNASVYPYTYAAETEVVGDSDSSEPENPSTTEKDSINISDVQFASDSFDQQWHVTFGEKTAAYVSAITSVTVNQTDWEKKDTDPSSGGAYRADKKHNRLVFAKKNFSSTPVIPVLKSGDIVTIQANGYNDLTFKFVVDTAGNASAAASDDEGDPYQLHVRLVGSFEAAIVGQKNYDAVSGATGSASSNKNSAVKVYGALVRKDTEPSDTDWQELNSYSSSINPEGSKCSVSIVPDTANGTAAGRDSGMEGVYMTISSDLTLNGTPKDAGRYLVSIHVEDDQGRTADLYWKTGIDAAPALSQYAITHASGYVLMNIPYDTFYAAEKGDSDTAAAVDAVSSATRSKPLSSLAANSYHKNSNGSDISGIIYPVYVSDLSALQNYKQVKDTDTLTITVSLRGQETTTEYKGKETLFEAPDYAYYVLPENETPASCKKLTVSDGRLTFGKTTAAAAEAADASVTLTANGHHAYYEMKVTGLADDIAGKVSAVTLHTTDSKIYGLRHVAEIWRGTELGFGTDGVYAGLQGKTIDTITYYLNDGTIQTITANIKVPKSTQNVTAAVASALHTAHEAAVTVENLPEDFAAQYAVAGGDSDLSAYHFAVENGKLTWTGTPACCTYTLTITDANGIYAPVSTSFELRTADVIAKYDASKKALVKAAADITDEQFAAYLKAISAVSVDGKSYAAAGRGAVTIVKSDGTIDLTAAPFSKGAGASYSMTVKAAGYPDLTFTLEVPKQSGGSSGGSHSSGGSSSGGSTAKPSQPGSSGNGGSTADKQYEDVKTGDWFYSAVDYVAAKNLMSGTGDNRFSPNAPTTRGMLMTVLARHAGTDTTGSTPWYQKSMDWAKANGVSDGTNPTVSITREQLVTMLYRYAGSPKASASLDHFSDAASVSSYAVNAMQWAVSNGIVNGSNGKLNPKNNATRAEVAAILMRFCAMNK